MKYVVNLMFDSPQGGSTITAIFATWEEAEVFVFENHKGPDGFAKIEVKEVSYE